jgi:hypothetical protein
MPGDEPFLRRVDFPAGTPPLVVDIAMFYQGRADPETRPMLRRLALDPRMPAVWRQLQRRRRDGGREYIYPVSREYIQIYQPPVGREQDNALAYLFLLAIWSVRSSVITKAQRDKWAESYLGFAACLRDMRQLFDQDEIAVGEELDEELDALDYLIAKCENHAWRIHNGIRQLVVARDRGDGKLRAYLANLAAEMFKLFGAAPRHQLATIASVALDRKVTAEMVRQAHKNFRCRGLLTSAQDIIQE